jgi:hypothetical protein
MAIRGKYPFASAWGFRTRGRHLVPLLRAPLLPGQFAVAPFTDWWFSGQIEKFGILKRWTGAAWVPCDKLNIRTF